MKNFTEILWHREVYEARPRNGERKKEFGVGSIGRKRKRGGIQSPVGRSRPFVAGHASHTADCLGSGERRDGEPNGGVKRKAL